MDLWMGGGYPNGVCGCTTPTSGTTSGATMSVAYVAACQTLDDTGWFTTPGTQLQIWDCTGNANPQWKLP